MNENLSPTIAKLRSLPNHQWHPVWPPGKRQPFSKAVAQRFLSLVSTNDKSLMALLHAHPDLPPWSQLNDWRRSKPSFAQAWKYANQERAHFLAEKCLDLQDQACPKTAHVVRVRFDVIKWMCAKFHPDAYGDKPPQQAQQTTVNVGISITPERLSEIRTKLDSTRLSLAKPASTNGRKALKNHASHPSMLSLASIPKRYTQHDHANGDHDQATDQGPTT